MSKRKDNAGALLIWLANNECIAVLILILTQAPLKWWLIAQMPVALMALLITAITTRSNTRGE